MNSIATIATPTYQTSCNALAASAPHGQVIAARWHVLPALGRVDAVQPYPLAGYLDRVAVDRAGRAGDVCQGEGG